MERPSLSPRRGRPKGGLCGLRGRTAQGRLARGIRLAGGMRSGPDRPVRPASYALPASPGARAFWAG